MRKVIIINFITDSIPEGSTGVAGTHQVHYVSAGVCCGHAAARDA